MRMIAAIWTLCWIAILIAGLWPFSTHRENKVSWRSGQEGGLHFGANGIAISSESLARYLGSENADRPFTIELLLRGEVQAENRLAGILVEDGTTKDPDLAMEQYADLFLLRGYFDDGTHHTYKKLGVKGAFNGDRIVHIAISSGDSGTKLFVNGVVEEQFHYRLLAKNLTQPFLVGNSGFLVTPRSGEMLALAMFSGERSPAQV